MRNSLKRLLSLLLVMAMLFALSMTCFAAEEKTLLTLTVTSENAIRGSEISVAVDTTKANLVADGKLTFKYDNKALCFVGAEAGKAWPEKADLSLQVNDQNPGTVIAAFAGAEAAGAGTVLTLKFAAVEEGQSTVALSSKDSYLTGVEDALDAQTKVVVDCPSRQFTDVDPDSCYHDGIDYVVANGLMIGMGNNHFGPNVVLSRAMMVTILYRMEGAPKVTGNMPFTDVKEGQYYYDAVLWAYQNKITLGMSDKLFCPSIDVSREQMVTLMARYASFKGITVKGSDSLKNFVDGSKVSEYARESMSWAIDNGLIIGVGDNKLSPRGSTIRAQAATVIARFAATFQN